MVWLFAVLGAVGVFVVAAVAVGRETFRLGHQIPATIIDIDEAVSFVSDDIPQASQARLTYEEVRVLIEAQLEHLRDQGVVGMRGAEPTLGTVGGTDLEDVVVADEEAVAVVLGHVDEAGLQVEDEDAYAVIVSLHRYLTDTGAVGPTA